MARDARGRLRTESAAPPHTIAGIISAGRYHSARLRMSSLPASIVMPGLLLSERQPVRLEEREQAERGRGAEHPRPGRRPHFSHPNSIRRAGKARQGGVCRSLEDCGSSLDCCSFQPWSAASTISVASSCRRPPVKAATASVSRAWSAGALQARCATAASSSRVLAEFLVGRVARFGQAVGEEHEPIAGADRDRTPARTRPRAARRAPGRRCRGARPIRRRAPASAGNARRWCR